MYTLDDSFGYTAQVVPLNESWVPMAVAEGPDGTLFVLDGLNREQVAQVDEQSGRWCGVLDSSDYAQLLRLQYDSPSQTLWTFDGVRAHVYVYSATSGKLVDTWTFSSYCNLLLLDIALTSSKPQLLVVTAMLGSNSTIMWLDVPRRCRSPTTRSLRVIHSLHCQLDQAAPRTRHVARMHRYCCSTHHPSRRPAAARGLRCGRSFSALRPCCHEAASSTVRAL